MMMPGLEDHEPSGSSGVGNASRSAGANAPPPPRPRNSLGARPPQQPLPQGEQGATQGGIFLTQQQPPASPPAGSPNSAPSVPGDRGGDQLTLPAPPGSQGVSEASFPGCAPEAEGGQTALEVFPQQPSATGGQLPALPLPTAKDMPPLQLGNTAGTLALALPELPRLPVLFQPGLLQALQIQEGLGGPGGMPPPPPPPLGQPRAPEDLLPPLPPRGGRRGSFVGGRGGLLAAAPRTLVPYRPDESGVGASGLEPKPPRKTQKFKAVPPVGPPPQHAYMLARKGAAPGTDVNVVPPPPPPEMIPHPPVDEETRRDSASSEEVSAYLRRLERERYAEMMRHREREAAKGVRTSKEPLPLPELVITASRWLLRLIVDGHIALCCYLIGIYGYHLRPRAVVAIHGATLVGSFVLFGLLETVKCLVVAAVALVKDESRKRTAELQQRKERMLMKSQRVKGEQRVGGEQKKGPDVNAGFVGKLAKKMQEGCAPLLRRGGGAGAEGATNHERRGIPLAIAGFLLLLLSFVGALQFWDLKVLAGAIPILLAIAGGFLLLLASARDQAQTTAVASAT